MILITGGAGYIGSHFLKTYLDTHENESVVVVDNLSEGYRDAILSPDRVHFYQANVGDVAQMTDILMRHEIEAVVHFAASCYVGDSEREPTSYFENNVVNTMRLLAAMEAANVRKLVFSSTCATYGNPQTKALDESHPQQPINIYGLTKLMVEQALQGYCRTQNWSVAALRYFNAAGADKNGGMGERHDPETHLIPLVLQVALGQREAIDIYGDDYDTPDGTCTRDYIHVTDLADAHCRALNYLEDHTGFSAFNLGTTHGASVQAVIEQCRKTTGHAVPARIVPRRPGDPASLVACADKANQILGWKPQASLEDIIASAWQWAQSSVLVKHEHCLKSGYNP